MPPASRLLVAQRRLALALRGGLAALSASGALGVVSSARAEPSSLPPEVGYDYGEVLTPRSASMGGAVRALGNPTEGLWQNPANMAATRVYHLGAQAKIGAEAGSQLYGLSAVDSIMSSSRLAGGVGGTLGFQDPEGIERRTTDLRFALAFPFGDKFFVGLGGRYFRLSQDGVGPLGDSAVSSGLGGENIVRSFGLDAGITLKPTELLAISLVGTNLTHPMNGFQPTTFGGGLGVGGRSFSVEADAIADFDSWGKTTARVMGGAEALLSDHYPLRFGYRWDQGLSSHALSGGLGYNDTAFAAELGVQRSITGPAATSIFFGFRYHLESSGLTPGPTDSF